MLLKPVVVDSAERHFPIHIVWEIVEADRLAELAGALAAILPVVQKPELREGVRPSLTVGGQFRALFFRGL